MSPAPVVIHIVAASIFSMLGAFQFSSQLRGRSSWHRVAGWLLLPCGMATALSALWMTLLYPSAAMDGAAVFLLRLFFGGAMAVSMVLAVVAIGRRDFPFRICLDDQGLRHRSRSWYAGSHPPSLVPSDWRA